MTKEVITAEQAMQYLNVLVALDNTQIAKDTLEYFTKLQQENKISKIICNNYHFGDNLTLIPDHEILKKDEKILRNYILPF